MFIKMEIQDKSGNKKTIEIKSDHTIMGLMKFMAKIREYANPNWVILSIKTDNPHMASYLETHQPDLPIELTLEE